MMMMMVQKTNQPKSEKFLIFVENEIFLFWYKPIKTIKFSL